MALAVSKTKVEPERSIQTFAFQSAAAGESLIDSQFISTQAFLIISYLLNQPRPATHRLQAVSTVVHADINPFI